MTEPYRIPLAVNNYGSDELLAVHEVMTNGSLTCGERVEEFERVVAEDYGVRDAVLVNSGGSANLLAMTVLTAPSGWVDGTPEAGSTLGECVVPALTWSTGLWPVRQSPLFPSLADVSMETLNVTAETVDRVLNEHTEVLFPAHLLGNPAPVDELAYLCRRRGIHLLEDACESLDATLGGKVVGSFGRMGTLSFYFSHHVSTIEGGMVLCNDATDAARVRSLRAHGWSRPLPKGAKARLAAEWPDVDPAFCFVEEGYSLKPTEIQAALGLVQWRRRGEWLAARRRIGTEWGRRVRDAHPDLFESMLVSEGSSHFAFPLVLREDAPTTRNALRDHLEANGVQTRPVLAGNLARHPAAMRRALHAPVTQVADAVQARGLYVGLHPTLTEDDVEHLVRVVDAFASCVARGVAA